VELCASNSATFLVRLFRAIAAKIACRCGAMRALTFCAGKKRPRKIYESQAMAIGRAVAKLEAFLKNLTV
jgi:hypothetical protein